MSPIKLTNAEQLIASKGFIAKHNAKVDLSLFRLSTGKFEVSIDEHDADQTRDAYFDALIDAVDYFNMLVVRYR